MVKDHSDSERETRCRHIGYSFRLAVYAPSQRQDNTYHGLCYTSRGALAGTRNSSVGPPHEGSIRRPIAPWANKRRGNEHWQMLCVCVNRPFCPKARTQTVSSDRQESVSHYILSSSCAIFKTLIWVRCKLLRGLWYLTNNNMAT